MKVAVLLPCYNEAISVADVVRSFRTELPEAEVFVLDNNSTDETAARAEAAGAIVMPVRRQGKGFVLATAFERIDADLYVMADGDGTYPASHVRKVMAPALAGSADMVVGNRLAVYEEGSYRPLHVIGNRLIVWTINRVFGSNLCDALSGYRCFTREFVDGMVIMSRGFEVETELSLQALYRRMRIVEVEIPYAKRPAGSHSKLSTFRDGFRVLVTIIDLFKAYRPLAFFAVISALVALLGLGLGAFPILEFARTGFVRRFPTAFLAATLEVVAVVILSCGVVLDIINHHFRELSQLVSRASRAKISPKAPLE